MKEGKVYLIGAGPGDPELFTLKGKRCLSMADVVVDDYLADKRLLRFARPDVEYIYVGKKAGSHTMTQEEIGQLLVEKGKEGKIVARLKGGDPFVFGRGGEEAEALRKAGIPFEQIPGVTSAIAAPAYAGIPVTHRGLASSFAVITGHEDAEKEKSTIHWESLATAVDTLIFLMGVGHIQEITEQLMRYGRSPDTPAAFVRWGTRPYQETYVTTVGQATEDVKKHGVRPPAVFIVGDVVACRQVMRWYDNQPLFGKRIVVTRTRMQASKLSKLLEEAGAECMEIPSIRIEKPTDKYASLDAGIESLSEYQWIVFTSQNGVSAFFDRLHEKGLDSRALGTLRIATIGVATAKELENYGLHADCVPTTYKAEELAELMKEKARPGEKIWVPRAKEARSVFFDEMRAFGCEVDVAEAYCTVADESGKEELIELLEDKKVDIITFTSSSTVTNLMKQLDGKMELLKGVTLACIGPVTADTCRSYGWEPAIVSDVFTIKGLVEAIQKGVASDEM